MNQIEQIVLTILKHHQEQIYTSFPAVVTKYDEDGQQATIKPAIDGLSVDLVVAVPVHHIGGNWGVVTEINEGTEGMVSVCMRDISGWLSGSESKLDHQFNANDAWFTPGVRSEAKALKNAENNGVRLCNADNSKYFWLKNDGRVYSNCILNIDNDVNITGALNVDQKINCKDDIISKGEVVTRISHKHPYTDDGSQMETGPAEQE